MPTTQSTADTAGTQTAESDDTNRSLAAIEDEYRVVSDTLNTFREERRKLELEQGDALTALLDAEDTGTEAEIEVAQRVWDKVSAKLTTCKEQADDQLGVLARLSSRYHSLQNVSHSSDSKE